MLSLRHGTLEESHIWGSLEFLSSAWATLSKSHFELFKGMCHLGAGAMRSVNESLGIDEQGKGMGPSFDCLHL